MKEQIIRLITFYTVIVLVIILNTFPSGGQEIYQSPLCDFNNFPKGAKYQDATLSASERTKDVIKHLTFEEVLMMTGGWNKFFVPGIARLGLRPVFMANASQGVNLRKEFTDETTSTSFPGALALASTWNEYLAKSMGISIGKECRICGVDFLLGPGVNMQRFSISGRNYEYYGEDPILTSHIAVKFIQGLQSQKVIATAKHFIGNDQEFCRHITSSNIDERTLREIYLYPWEAIIREAGVKAIMTGNNLINGTPNAMNKVLLNDIIREEYGFTGVSMTDWQNTNYFPDSQHLFLPSGMSLLMPDNNTFATYLKKYLEDFPKQKRIVRNQLEKKVYQNLLPLFEMGIYDRQIKDKSLVHEMEGNKNIACEIAEEAICVLKNEKNILPINKEQKIILTGDIEMYCGRGSGFVSGYDHVNFREGLTQKYGRNIQYIAEPSEAQVKAANVIIYSLNKEAGEGLDVPFEIDINHRIEWLSALNPNMVVIINSCNGLPMPWLDEVKAVLWCYFLGQERGSALAKVLSGEICPSGHLPFTIEKDFKDSQNPQYNYLGNKPYWYGNNNFYKEYWLGRDSLGANEHFRNNVKPHQIIPINYTEGIFIGYRWYEKQEIDVLFPFGHGLSYTSFEFSSLNLSKEILKKDEELKVSLVVTNTGDRKGKEVVQLYIADKNCSVLRPVKELKHFRKIELLPGENESVSFLIQPKDLSFWDVKTNEWKIESGEFEVFIGASSQDIRLRKKFNFE